jgi:hypothetical protein
MTTMTDLHVIKCTHLNCCDAVASPYSMEAAEAWAEQHGWMSMDGWRCAQHAQAHMAFMGARPAFEIRDGVGTCVEHCLLYDGNRPGKSRARCHIRGRTTVQGAPCHVWVRDFVKKEQRP